MSSTVFLLCWLVTMMLVYPDPNLGLVGIGAMLVASVVAVVFDIKRLRIGEDS